MDSMDVNEITKVIDGVYKVSWLKNWVDSNSQNNMKSKGIFSYKKLWHLQYKNIM